MDPLEVAMDAANFVDPEDVEKVLSDLDLANVPVDEPLTLSLPVVEVDAATFNQYMTDQTESMASLG